MDFLDTIAKLLGTNELGIIIVFLFGYFSLRYLLEKNIEELHEIDKIIFGTSIGVISFIILREIFILILKYINILLYLKIPIDGLKFSSMLYIIFIFGIISLSLVFKELYNIIKDKKSNKSNTDIIKRLQEPIKDLLIIFIVISVITLILSIFSYFTIQKIISWELLRISLVLSIITLFIYNYYCISYGTTIKKETQFIFKKIKKNITITKTVTIIISIILISFFIFPNIEYSPETIKNYAYDNELPRLSNEIINQMDVYYFEKIEQPISIKRQGLLGWIPIENKGFLIYNDSIKKFKNIDILNLNVKIKDGYYLKEAGITNKSFDENYNSFIIEFNKLNKSNIESITLTGYRKINLDKSSLDISIDVDTENKIQLNITNNLDKPIILLDEKRLKSLNTDETCSLYLDKFEAYYQNKKIPTQEPTTNDYKTSISLHSNSNDINFQIAEQDNDMILGNFEINPNTRLEIIIDINCK